MAKQQSSDKTPLFMHLAVAKENREIPVKERHAGGKWAEFRRVYSVNMNTVMKTNLLFTVFALPFFVLTIWALNYMLGLADARFFIGGIGIDYHPGLVDELQRALLARLDVHFFYFLLLIPAFMIMGLGLAGAYHISRKLFYGEEVNKILKTFGQGIKKYWWKMMLLGAVIGIIVFCVAVAMIEFFKAQTLGVVAGWWYAVLVFTFLFAVILMFIVFQIAPQIVTYDKLKFSQIIKNSCILSIENFILTLIFCVAVIAPILLAVLVSFLGLLVYMIMFMFGFMFYIMANLQIGNYAFDLYVNPMYDMLGESANLPKKKKEETVVNNPPQTQKPKKKKPQPQKYVNPKKKKSTKK